MPKVSVAERMTLQAEEQPVVWQDGDLLDRLATAVWIFDIDEGRVVWGNEMALEIWAAISLEELRARRMKDNMSPAVSRRLLQYQTDFIDKNAVFTEMWTLYPRGVPRPLQVRFSGFRLPDGRMAMLCEGRDEMSLVPEAIRSADVLLHTHLMISLHTIEGRTLYCNPAARADFDIRYGSLSDRFVNPQDFESLLQRLNGGGEARLIAEVYTAQGKRWHELIARSCFDPVSGSPSLILSESDVTELKEAEALAQKLAHHDPLTGLFNRLSLPIRFEELTTKAELTGSRISLLFIDLDQFKTVNDTLGHLQGDNLLRDVARRLREICSEDDIVVRLAGDEFLFLLFQHNDMPCRVKLTADRVLDKLAISVESDRHQIVVTPSIGIAHYPDHGTDIQTLMRRADLAMYQAKAAGRNQVFVYNEALSRAREKEIELLTGLRDGLRYGQIVPFYQPRVSAVDGSIIGMEALARWKHPKLGMVPPSTFIPLAEKAGLINQIGTIVLEQAVEQREKWMRNGIDLTISVNLSLRQLCETDFSAVVEACLNRHSCPPERLELELTETLFSDSDPIIQENLNRIRELGVRIAIDDFGTGYSNIARLNELAVDCIKIDRSLVSQLPKNEEMVSLVIAMCKLMQVTIVAEGIENETVAEWVRSHGVHELQGYLYGAPLPAACAEKLARNSNLQFADISVEQDHFVADGI